MAEYTIAMDAALPSLIVITGPTGVGKSDLALEIASQFGAEIVSADSRQVYRLLDIGTAKPTLVERSRVTHHLVDYVDPDESYSVVRFRDDGDRVLTDLGQRSTPALVVGGTGHYIQALVDRIEPPIVPPDLSFRAELEQIAADHGFERLHTRLVRLDPDAAASIPASNVRRVIRALEVIAATGEPFSQAGRRRSQPLSALKIALTIPRDRLYCRVDARVDRMLAAGWVEEVRSLIARGFAPTLPALSSTGYSEIVAYLAGDLAGLAMVQKIKWATHAYIRRQLMWLRRRSDYHTIEASPDGFAVARDLVALHLSPSRSS